MALPITVTCECGEVASADLGQRVTCSSCGRTFDTSKLKPGEFGSIHGTAVKMGLYTRLLLVFIAAVTVLAALKWGVKGAAIGGPIAAIIWFRFLGKWYKRRWLKNLDRGRTLPLEAE